jgi:hypothetical protein
VTASRAVKALAHAEPDLIAVALSRVIEKARLRSALSPVTAHLVNSPQAGPGLEHDPEKHALGLDPRVGTGFPKRSCSNKKIERNDDSKKSHPALGETPGLELLFPPYR